MKIDFCKRMAEPWAWAEPDFKNWIITSLIHLTTRVDHRHLVRNLLCNFRLK